MLRVAVAVSAVLLTSPAFAKFPCDELWGERNAVYFEAGYCFKTDRAIRAFGLNEGCRYTNIQDVPLSARDRKKIAEIQDQERANNCPR
ncbi:YARHG domain-containing protein [Hansschlegelia sp. KR7-227]|jgi:hypothetical protein|uniref:YARHG domain-containing protein n=1 Tax=Hansschlegelia sp. KR7-227 TaxID=3400914 RepID=UPI003BFE560B